MSYKRRRKSGNRLIKSKKTTIDGIKFQSRLESSMYKLLKESGLPFEYEKETFTVVGSFKFDNDSYERNANGKGDVKQKGGGKVVREMKYTPDFIVPIGKTKYIIETKGFKTSEFNMRYKLFKKYITDNKLDYHLYMPHTKTECAKVLQIIKSKINELQ